MRLHRTGGTNRVAAISKFRCARWRVKAFDLLFGASGLARHLSSYRRDRGLIATCKNFFVELPVTSGFG